MFHQGTYLPLLDIMSIDQKMALLDALKYDLFEDYVDLEAYQVQSEDVIEGEVPVSTTSYEVEEKENVSFVDTNVIEDITYSTPVDETFYATADEVSSIATFMSRPVNIWSYNWTEAGFAQQTFDPWTLFLNDTRVKKKIDNFLFISCRLHVKFVINCSPFLYGAVYVSYRPFLHKPLTFDYSNGMQLALSQMPGFWIFPQDNGTYEMDLPFFWLRDWLQLTNASEINKMGNFILSPYTELTSANGAATSGVTISVFASAHDVKLSGPTVATALQARDEYATGPVSSIASAIAKSAGALTRVPLIGVFARATEIGAGAASRIAALFGFSNPPVIEDAKPFKNMPFAHLASAGASEPVSKLTFDPKAELCVDPRTVGLDGADELAIANIVTRESYLTSFQWPTSDAADTLKFNCAVNPSLSQIVPQLYGSTVAFTPMSHLAEMFNNWRGDIEFRFKVVCSKFHRGRLRITWDPIGPIATTAGTQTTNVAYTRIVDVGEETDITIRVPYMQAKPYLQTYPAASGNPGLYQTSDFSNFTAANGTPSRYNGQITVRVLNVLSAPIDTSSVYVLVYVRGCENLQFQNPISISDKFSYFELQSKDEIVPVTHENNKASLICYGEAYDSVRTVLRRHTLLESYPLDTTSTTALQVLGTFQFKKFPYSPGFNITSYPYATQAHGIATPGSNFYYTWCHMTPLAWMASCYLGRRGAIRYAFHFDDTVSSGVRSARVFRTTDVLTAGNSFYNTTVPAGASWNTYLRTIMAAENRAGFEGVVQFDNDIQSGITVELPQMINNRFEICDVTSGILGSSVDATDRETYVLQYAYQPVHSGANLGVLRRYVSIGTDFTMFFYLNAPMVRLYNLGPSQVTPS